MQTYKYINIGGKYFGQQQSLLKLANIIIFDRSSLPGFINWKLLLRLILHRIGFKKYSVLELPVSGVWCFPVRFGCKIFDPYENSVTKIFDDSVDQEFVEKEIEQHRYIGRYDFAPKIKRWDKKERWYQEEFVLGKSSYYFSPESTSEFMQIYYTDIAPCLVRLMNVNDNNPIRVREYMAGMDAEIQVELQRIDMENPILAKPIKKFYDSVIKELARYSNETLYLVFAHGDFHLFNLFKTDSGMKLIDWEGSSQRSLMYDFFNYFFSHLWTGRTKDDYVGETTQAIDDMIKRLGNTNDELAKSLSEKSQLYLLVFYMERFFDVFTVFKNTPETFQVWVNVYSNYETNKKRLMESGVI